MVPRWTLDWTCDRASIDRELVALGGSGGGGGLEDPITTLESLSNKWDDEGSMHGGGGGTASGLGCFFLGLKLLEFRFC